MIYGKSGCLHYSASVTAVFELEDGNEKSFMRSVQGSSSEHRINNNVGTICFCVNTILLVYLKNEHFKHFMYSLHRLSLVKYI